MVKFSGTALLGALLAWAADGSVAAFCPSNSHKPSTTTATTTSTQLYIIGPMIRKMREADAKKKMPMAEMEEALKEAPGLRVGSNAWKWPPIWPYDQDFFVRKDELGENTPSAISSVQSLLTGSMPQMPAAATQIETLNVMDYWQTEGNVPTDLDEAAAAKLTSHYAFYLRDGMSVLELGAAEKSYLPPDLKLSRHVGVGASQTRMDQNPALTETLVVDLNDVEEGKVVNSNPLRALAARPFDAVIMANTIDFLTSPREVFRTAWALLKPGGIMLVPFTAKDAYADKFGKAQTKMWVDMTNDQHMWICGSFFQFSAGEGWQDLKGFDISPVGAQQESSNPLDKLLQKGKPTNMYVVQATKVAQDETIDPSDPAKSFKSKMWMLPTMEERDKFLVAPRLARVYQAAQTEEEKAAIAERVEVLPKVYESLIKMDQFTFDFSLQAQLAANLIADPDFCANDEQIAALKQGLGLRKPSADFWAPVGQATLKMKAEDKVNLLAYIVPRFGSHNDLQDAALESFVSGLKPTFAVIRQTCPGMSESDVELLGSELLASEILQPGRSTRAEFAAWLGALTKDELLQLLAKRKSYKETADQDLAEFKRAKAEREAQVADLKKKMDQQVEKARKERTMALNPKTGKMEPIKKKK